VETPLAPVVVAPFETGAVDTTIELVEVGGTV